MSPTGGCPKWYVNPAFVFMWIVPQFIAKAKAMLVLPQNGQ